MSVHVQGLAAAAAAGRITITGLLKLQQCLMFYATLFFSFSYAPVFAGLGSSSSCGQRHHQPPAAVLCCLRLRAGHCASARALWG
jgi:hypothetical protein